MKVRILNEIRRLAKEADGKPPGAKHFQTHSGIGESAWRGVYWARWSEAIAEAGLTPNLLPEERRIADDELLRQLAMACRHYGRVPTVAELKLFGRSRPDFPNFKTIERRFGGFSQLGVLIGAWTADKPEFADVVPILGAQPVSPPRSRVDGSVYLLQSGAFFKVGRSDDVERRVKEITIALPEKVMLIHSISTDDPPGIEAYWHRRFADRRANGEWFKLSREDIAAFKRRKFQ